MERLIPHLDEGNPALTLEVTPEEQLVSTRVLFAYFEAHYFCLQCFRGRFSGSF